MLSVHRACRSICILIITMALPAFCQELTSTSFFDILKAGFQTWDINHDGILTGDEIAADLQNPQFTAREAAALAALKTQERFDMRNTKHFADFTLQDVYNLEREYEHGDRQALALVRYFNMGVHKLQKQAPSLFSGQRPHIIGIQQGHTSDCYFLSAVASFAEARPNDLMALFTANSDGTFTVNLHHHQPIVLPPPSSAEVATYSDAGADGVWLTVLEKAYALAKEQRLDMNMTEPLDAVTIRGGSPSQVIYYLTGHKAHFYPFKNPSVRACADQLLSEAFANHCVVTTTVPGHVLAVVKYDPQQRAVQIWNPWGTNRVYKTIDVRMNHGCFWMPVQEWVTRFRGVSIEQRG